MSRRRFGVVAGGGRRSVQFANAAGAGDFAAHPNNGQSNGKEQADEDEPGPFIVGLCRGHFFVFILHLAMRSMSLKRGKEQAGIWENKGSETNHEWTQRGGAAIKEDLTTDGHGF